jgi:hypothetical protein
MRYVAAFILFALLILPAKLLLGDEAIALTAVGILCLLVIHSWPKSQSPGGRTPGSTS